MIFKVFLKSGSKFVAQETEEPNPTQMSSKSTTGLIENSIESLKESINNFKKKFSNMDTSDTCQPPTNNTDFDLNNFDCIKSSDQTDPSIESDDFIDPQQPVAYRKTADLEKLISGEVENTTTRINYASEMDRMATGIDVRASLDENQDTEVASVRPILKLVFVFVAFSNLICFLFSYECLLIVFEFYSFEFNIRWFYIFLNKFDGYWFKFLWGILFSNSSYTTKSLS